MTNLFDRLDMHIAPQVLPTARAPSLIMIWSLSLLIRDFLILFRLRFVRRHIEPLIPRVIKLEAGNREGQSLANAALLPVNFLLFSLEPVIDQEAPVDWRLWYSIGRVPSNGEPIQCKLRRKR